MIYFDHAATTPADKRVIKAMMPYFSDVFANPSSLYSPALKAKEAIEKSRKTIAEFLNCDPSEVIFTNGGTESNNLAILGVGRMSLRALAEQSHSGGIAAAAKSGLAMTRRKPHIITSQIEHDAVLNSCRQLEKEGLKVTYLPVGKDGVVKISELKGALTRDTILVSIMYANNEIGTIQPIAKISEIVRHFRKANPYPLFHTDACQAMQYLPMDVKKLGVDLLTLNGSKIYGPKGIGALYVREGVELEPTLYGGGQEKNLRPGTENVPGIVGLGKAIEIVGVKGKEESIQEKKLRDYIIGELLKISNSRLNGSRTKRLPNNINVSLDGVEGESLVLYLDKEGIYASTGSACTSKSLEPSHVIMALDGDAERAHGSLRVTIGRSTTAAQADRLISAVKKYVKKLREMSAV